MIELKYSSRAHYPNGFLIKYETDTYTRELNISISGILESAECFKRTCPNISRYLSKKSNKPYTKIAIETAKQIVSLIGTISLPKLLEINISKIDVCPISGVRYLMIVKNGEWLDTLIFNVDKQNDIEIFTKAFMKYYNKIKQEK